MNVEHDVVLSRFTTLGTGGPANAFARPESIADLGEALAFAHERGVPVATIGLGSNVLVADEGFSGLVLKLGGDLARVEVQGDRLIAGGGVWMNAGAYGRDWAGIVERALVVDCDGAEWRTADDLGLRYRRSDLRHGQVVAKVEFLLERRPADEIKAIVADLQAQRKAAQPTNKRTYGSVFKNPEHELTAGRMLEACGLKGYRIGGARISPRHANFIENADGARSSDAVALMAEARRRAWEQFGVELEHEVVFLGPLELPALSR